MSTPAYSQSEPTLVSVNKLDMLKLSSYLHSVKGFLDKVVIIDDTSSIDLLKYADEYLLRCQTIVARLLLGLS
jgi:hypothetical protein